MTFTCPVCGYRELPRPAADDLICPSCGTQFGYHDCSVSQVQLRREWIRHGLKWHSRVIPYPPNWNPFVQLVEAGFAIEFVGSNMTEQVTRTVVGDGPQIIIKAAASP
jgi:hypothetical protein